jgi:serine/threonine-protein kinase
VPDSISCTPDAVQRALAGRYSIDRELGRGGMGVVYLAREVRLDRLVAIKLLPPDRATPELRERFLREARTAARLSHPNIIPIHAVEETAAFTYFVMGFVDGETLTQRVRARGPLGASEGVRVLREVAWALAYAHEQGLVHRDVKPDNILLEHGSGRVLVADFGIAAASDDAGADAAGTPEFMSPEQILGRPADARSDLYSLGATAFYAFSGRFPFEGRSATEVLAKHVSEPAPPLGALGLSVPRRVATIIDRCLAKDPLQRTASAQVLAEQLGLALEQRRELPMALRAFVKRSARLDGGGTVVGIIGTGLGAIAALRGWGPAGAVSVLAGGALFTLGWFVKAARGLSLLGFAHRDLPAAFRAEIEQSEEEMAAAASGPPTWLERWVPRVRIASLLAAGVGVIGAQVLTDMRFYSDPGPITPSVLLGLRRLDVLIAWAMKVGAYGSMTFLGSLLASYFVVQRRRDVDTVFWSRLWTGPVGHLAFAIGARLPGRRALAPSLTHRATELALGIAAGQLYERLPRATRQQLGDVPALVQRLQEDATTLRARLDELQDALVACGDAADTDAFRDLRAVRDATQAQLADAVAALETIRLELLRLHAGADAVASLTTQLGLAAEVSAEVRRLVWARAEVDAMLRFPREAAATPA